MLIQITIISDLEEALMTLGLEARTTSLKIWVDCKTLFIMSEEISILVSSIRY